MPRAGRVSGSSHGRCHKDPRQGSPYPNSELLRHLLPHDLVLDWARPRGGPRRPRAWAIAPAIDGPGRRVATGTGSEDLMADWAVGHRTRGMSEASGTAPPGPEPSKCRGARLLPPLPIPALRCTPNQFSPVFVIPPFPRMGTSVGDAHGLPSSNGPSHDCVRSTHLAICEQLASKAHRDLP